MELVQCKKNVYHTIGDSYIEKYPSEILFKEGNFYMVHKDEYDDWYTLDEDGVEHVVASDVKKLTDDHWFNFHFNVL